MALTWHRATDEFGRPAIVANTPAGDTYTIDGHGYGRMRWTVWYPDGTYGITDSQREAKAWAELHAAHD